MPTRSALVTVVLATLALAGCSASLDTELDTLPDGVEVSVFQNRSDYSTRTLVIGVANGGSEPLDLERVEFSSPRFDDTAVWDRGTTVRAGGQVDLRVPLPATVCGVSGAPSIRVIFTTSTGMDGAATITPVDSRDRLDQITREECLIEDVARLASITISRDVDWTPGAHAPATVRLEVERTDAAGDLSIDAVHQTVLLSLVDAAPASNADTLSFVPSRCDPHAVAEDKLGTVFAVDVTVDGTSGTISVAASDETRVEIYDYIADYCGY